MSKNRGSLRAGTAKIEITPQDLTGLANLWGRPFEGVHDQIYVRAIVVDNGINRAVIVASDLVEYGDTSEIRQRIEKESGIPATHIIITASHDHNAPRVGSVTPGATAQKGGPATERYTRFVYDRILDVVLQAQATLQPARVGVGKGRTDVNTNRDIFTAGGWTLGANPDGPSEKTVWVVKFETESGEPMAILLNYAVHSVILGPNNTLITGDLAGAVERYVEQSYGNKVVALWTLGAAGDQNPKYRSYEEHPPLFENRLDGYALMDSLGQMLGEEVVYVADRIGRMKSEVRIEADERVVSIPARIPPRDANRPGMEVKAVDALNMRLGLLMIGQIALTWVSGEVVTQIYWHLRQASPYSNTIMITIANDRVGYIVDDAGYDTPTFAATASPLQRGYAEPAIVNGLVDMMEK
ncbi:MAG: neutral/alkaline non-lysosomal ceramidase N-terminal domain-containing protein [Chloroflexota bacterium]